jgi:hypothetical protein
VQIRKFLLMTVACSLAVSLLGGAACARKTVADANPIAAGCEGVNVKNESAAVCGYAIYGTFVIAEETAAKVATDVGEGATRNAIIAADEKAKPIADKLSDALAQYETIRGEVAAGRSTEEKLGIALVNVNRYINDTRPLVADLLKAIARART